MGAVPEFTHKCASYKATFRSLETLSRVPNDKTLIGPGLNAGFTGRYIGMIAQAFLAG